MSTRRTVDRDEELPADAAAKAVASGLGAHVATWARVSGWTWRTLPVALVLVTGTIKFCDSACEFVVFLLLIAVVVWTIFGRTWTRQRLYAFTDGLMLRDCLGALRAVRWAEVTTIRCDLWRWYVITGADGRRLVINSVDFSRSPELRAFIEREAERHRLAMNW
jgi:hypothetical protein